MEAVNGIIVRRATLDDLEVLTAFNAAMARETEGRSLDTQRLRDGTAAVLKRPERGFYLVAEAPGAASRLPGVVGQLLVTFEWSDWRNATFWWIQSVYVAPTWRRRGVYRTMHEAVVAQARAREDVCGIRLYVEGDNEVAQTVYRKVGLQRSSYVVFEEDFVLKRSTDLLEVKGPAKAKPK
jgi:ribosomal protein S18 acetylase RimI-like enzyme